MSATLVLSLLVGYFLLLVAISWVTGKKSDNQSFFLGNNQSPWYVVAFGMIGVSLSGVTFVSIPGWVNSSQFAYLQMAMGYVVGYLVIAYILMPIYYKLKLTSIYEYLRTRFGFFSHKTGAFFFLLSRTIGAAFRLYLVVIVMQEFVFDELGIPVWVTTIISILLIWLYTFKSGIKTVIWTDTLQTFFMLLAVGLTIKIILTELDYSFLDALVAIRESNYSQLFFFKDFNSPTHFVKYFLGGAFIAIAMTGLDQDLMQKNLSCRNIRDAQKNMNWFSIVLFFVNALFLCLGALLYIYTNKNGIAIPERTDLLYPTIAKNHLGVAAGSVFFIGLIAAAYSSADSALTALTTSFCVDFLGYADQPEKLKPQKRYLVHLSFSTILFLLVLLFNVINEQSVIVALFKAVSYTYGPLLGLYSFGIFTKRKVKDKLVPIITFLSPVICLILNENSKTWFEGYQFGFELLILNGLITFMGLLLISRNKKEEESYE